jgi:hypothetical protein
MLKQKGSTERMVKVERATAEDIEELANIYLEGYAGLEEYAYTHREDVLAYLNWLFRRDVAGVFVARGGRRKGRVCGSGRELV